jgi:hypothetical protein
MEREGFDLIVLGIGSEIPDVIQYTSRGKAFEYYHLLCKRGGSYDEFMLNCRGGTINDKAREVTKAVTNEGSEKDVLRSVVTKMILDAISNIVLPLLISFLADYNRYRRQVRSQEAHVGPPSTTPVRG